MGVLVLSQYAEAAYAVELIGDDARGVGYLLKDRVSDFEEFARALRRVAAGGSVLDPEVVHWMFGRERVTSRLAERLIAHIDLAVRHEPTQRLVQGVE
jgi:DNA-binding NarL/FixJ family response regulator